MGIQGRDSAREEDVASPFKRGTLKDECYRRLVKAGPNGLKVNDLVKGIREARVGHLAGSTPANTVCSALSSGATVFARIAPGTYALTASAAIQGTTQSSKKGDKAKPPSSRPNSGPKKMRRLDSLDSLPACSTSSTPNGIFRNGSGRCNGRVCGNSELDQLEPPSPPRTPLCNPSSPPASAPPTNSSNGTTTTGNPAPNFGSANSNGTTTSSTPAAVRPRRPRRSSLAKLYQMSADSAAPKVRGQVGIGNRVAQAAAHPRWLSQRDACLKVLAEAGPEGMTVNEVVDAIIRRSLAKLNGRTPHNSITRCLSADESFIRLQPGRYALHATRMAMCAEVLSLFSAPLADHAKAAADNLQEEEDSCQREDYEGPEDDQRDKRGQRPWSGFPSNRQNAGRKLWRPTGEKNKSEIEVDNQDFDTGLGDDMSETGGSNGSFVDFRTQPVTKSDEMKTGLANMKPIGSSHIF